MATEKRLIDAYALSESISGIGENMKRPRAVELACLVMISEAPTVDAVEVVRCKDCKHWSMGYCNHFAYYSYEPVTNKDGFCYYGERKANAHK